MTYRSKQKQKAVARPHVQQPQKVVYSTYQSYDQLGHIANYKYDMENKYDTYPYRQSTISSINDSPVLLRNSAGSTGRKMQPTIIESVEVMPGPSSAFRPATIIHHEQVPISKTTTTAQAQIDDLVETVRKQKKELEILKHTNKDLEDEIIRLKSINADLEIRNQQRNEQFNQFQTQIEKDAKTHKGNSKYSWQKFVLQFKLFNRPSKEQLQKKNILKSNELCSYIY